MRPVFGLPALQCFRYCARRRSALASFSARWSSTNTRQWSTPLAKTLSEAISTTGPISIANYMRQCLTSPEGGFYTTRTTPGTDQFGRAGDFITSPEISQIFGELVGIWFVAEWMAQGKQTTGIQLIELGPGRGTLMSDILRAIRNFKTMASAIDTIYLVEASPSLREVQKELLCGEVNIRDHKIGHQSSSKHLPGIPVVWTEDVSFLPADPNKSPFIIAHEFFDALPIHAFQSILKTQSQGQITTSTSQTPHCSSQNEWRELVVSTTRPPSVIKPPKDPGPEFQLNLSPVRTHYSQLLPAISPRYSALLSSAGSTIEISPHAQTTATHLTHMIAGKSAKDSSGIPASGAALIVDYGPTSTVPISTLRGIQSHQRTSPFSSAGLVDVSADVDFGALAETALASSPDVEVHGPVEQGAWLVQMGGAQRAEMLVQAASNKPGEEGKQLKERINSGWKRLIDVGINGMGKLYKVMAILPRQDEKEGRRPVGFGGDV